MNDTNQQLGESTPSTETLQAAFDNVVEQRAVAVLRRVITTFDADEKMPFLAALRAGRRLLGISYDADRDAEERDVLAANGIDDK